jgi:hypothetical protein
MSVISWNTQDYTDFLTLTNAIKKRSPLTQTFVYSNTTDGNFNVYCFFDKAEPAWIALFDSPVAGPPATFSTDFPDAVYLEQNPEFRVNYSGAISNP